MPTVNEIPTNIRCIEFRQSKGDPDYGKCLYARFYFNLDKYELTIISDCGNYGYKWIETPRTESFLELMSRIDGGYLLDKLYGPAKIFDYEKTKESLLKEYEDSYKETKEELNRILQNIEDEYVPETAEDFVRRFEDERLSADYDVYDSETLWSNIKKSYPSDILKIISIFEKSIVPAICLMLNNN